MNSVRSAYFAVFCGGLAFFCSFIDRLAWPPVIPLAAAELGLNAAQSGGFMSAFFLGYLLTQFPGGILADRFGTRKVLLVSLAGMAVFTGFMVYIDSLWSGLTARLLAGLGSGAIMSASVKGIHDFFPASKRAAAMGLFMAFGPLGLLAANLGAPAIAAGSGWRSVFGVAACITLLALVLVFILFPGGQVIGNRREGLRREFLQRNLVMTAIAGFFAMWGTWGTLTWANAYMQQGLSLSMGQAGKMMGLFAMGALIGQPLAGFLSDRWPQRRKQTSMLILAGFSCLLLAFGWNQNLTTLFILSLLLGAGAFVFGPVLNTMITEMVPAGQVGAAIGLCNAVWQTGSLVSPVAAGMVLDSTGNFFWAFALLAAGPLLAAFLLWRTVRLRDHLNH